MSVGQKVQVEISEIDEKGKLSLIPVEDEKSDAAAEAPSEASAEVESEGRSEGRTRVRQRLSLIHI